jgi:hypothetical protein
LQFRTINAAPKDSSNHSSEKLLDRAREQHSPSLRRLDTTTKNNAVVLIRYRLPSDPEIACLKTIDSNSLNYIK